MLMETAKSCLYRHRNSPPRMLVRWLCLGYFRFSLFMGGLFNYSLEWTFSRLGDVMQSHGESVWLGFGLLNFVTGSVYYLSTFDGKGTSAPEWTSWLG